MTPLSVWDVERHRRVSTSLLTTDHTLDEQVTPGVLALAWDTDGKQIKAANLFMEEGIWTVL